jgi:hypothetical protein
MQPAIRALRAPRSRSAARTVLLAVGALALTVLFLDQHRGELDSLVGSARTFVGAVGDHGVLNVSDVGESTAGVGVAMLVVLAWYGLGTVVIESVRSASGQTSTVSRQSSKALDVASACALGAGAWSLLWLALGLIGLYRPSTALLALAGGVVLAARAAFRSRTTSGPRRTGELARGEQPPLTFVAALLAALPVTLALVAALAPPTAKDALQYHLSLPKVFSAAGGIVDVPDNIANYFALGAEMHGVWAMLVGRIVSPRVGEAAFGAIMFAFFPLLLAVVFGWSRERGLGRDWAWLATAMVAGVPTVFEVAGSGYVDLALTLYVTLAIRSVARWWETLDRASLVKAAMALGFALSVKLTAGFVVFVFALIVLARTRRTDPADRRAHESLVAGLAAPAAALALGSPWYLRTWVRTGSAVFPFFATVWPGRAPGWDPERSALLVGLNALYGGAQKGLADYLLTPLSLSLMGQREIAAVYEGVLGVSFLVGLALVVGAWTSGRLDAELKIAAAAAGAFFVWWLASAQVLRYLLPALPLLAVATAGAGAALSPSGRSLRWALAASVLAGEVVIVAWFAADDPLLAVVGAEPRAAYLGRRLDYYSYYRLINASLPADAKVWLVDMRRDTYHLERPYVGDYLFEDYTLRNWIEAAHSGADVQRRARAVGITHVLIRHDILFDYARSPLVDDRSPQASNVAKVERLRSFLADGTRVLRADGKFALVELVPSLEPTPAGSR